MPRRSTRHAQYHSSGLKPNILNNIDINVQLYQIETHLRNLDQHHNTTPQFFFKSRGLKAFLRTKYAYKNSDFNNDREGHYPAPMPHPTKNIAL
jgi:hypothetical protein